MSPYGVLDLSGNVSEWTSTRVRPVPPWLGREPTAAEFDAMGQDHKLPPETRRLAIVALGGDFAALTTALLAGDAATAREAAYRIGLSKHDDRVRVLIDGLSSPSAVARQACAEALAFRAGLDDRGVDALLRTLSDRVETVATAALVGLVRLDPPDLPRRIREAMKEQPRELVSDLLLTACRQHSQFGRRYLDLGRNDLAERSFTRAIEIDRRDPVLYNNRALAKLRSGDVEGCIRDCNDALALDPNLAMPYQKLAHAAVVKRDFDTAAEHADRAIRLSGGDYRIVRTRGLVRLESGDGDGARADFERACTLAPADEESAFLLGLCHERAGRRADAAAAYRRALSINPEFERAFGRLYGSIEERLKAVE